MYSNYNGYGGQAFSAPFGDLALQNGMFDIFRPKRELTDEERAERASRREQTVTDVFSVAAGIASQFGPQQPAPQAPPPPPPPPPEPTAGQRVAAALPWVIGGALILGGGYFAYQQFK